MRLVLHIVGKDFRRLRGPIALWLVVLGLKVAHGFALLAGEAPGRLMETAMKTTGMLAAIDVGLSVLIAAMLVQEDGLAGTRAFWLTRPVSAGRLLGAKALGGILLFGVAPVVVWLPWWWHCGYGVREMGLAAAETLGWQVLVLAPAAMVAALTDSLGRFFLWSLVLAAGVFTGLILAGQFFAVRSGPAGETRVLVVVAMLVAGAMAVTVQQFLGRRLMRSMAMGGVVFTLAMAVLGWWRWNVVERVWPLSVATMSDSHAERTGGAKLELADAYLDAVVHGNGREDRVSVVVDLRVTNLPRGRFAAGLVAREAWRFSSGPVVEFPNDSWLSRLGGIGELRTALMIGARDEETVRWVAARDAQMPVAMNRRRGNYDDARGPVFRTTDTLARSVAERMKRETPTYETTAKFQLLRADEWSETPLAPGVWQARDGHGVRFTAAEARGGGVALTRVETEATVLDRTNPLIGWMPWQRTHLNAVVVNRTAGDLVMPRNERVSDGVRVGTVSIRWFTSVPVKPSDVVRDGKWVTRPAAEKWLEEARVAVVEFSEEARFTRELKVEKFSVEPQ